MEKEFENPYQSDDARTIKSFNARKMQIDLSRISKPHDVSNSQFDIPTIKTYKS